MTDHCQSKNCADCNKKLSLFRFLNEDQLHRINESRFEVHFEAGEMLVKQGSPLTHIACLTQGLAKIHMESPDGGNYIMNLVKPFNIIGGPGFLVDNRHHLSVTALMDSAACFIQVDAYKKVLEENNQFAMAMIAYLNNRIIKHYQCISSLAHKHMQGKLAETILYLSEEIFGAMAFQSHLSRQDLAEMTGMTKESVIRVLKDWKDDGIVETRTDHFVIHNREALARIAKLG